MKTLQIGIMSRDKFQSRTIEIASGRYKPKKMNLRFGLVQSNHFVKY